MGTSGMRGAALVALVLLAGTAGCSGNGAASPTVAPTATPPPPGPTLSDADLETIGTTSCVQTRAATSVGTGQWRNSAIRCEVAAPDARVAGTYLIEINLNILGDGRAFMWGALTATNDGGSWQGQWTGVAEATYPNGTHRIGVLLDGAGAYAGLRSQQVWVTKAPGYQVLFRVESPA